MKPRSNTGARGRFSGSQEVTEILDQLEVRLDRIADRLNALWDRAVLEEEPPAAQEQATPLCEP